MSTLPDPADMSPDELRLWDRKYVLRYLHHWRTDPLSAIEDEHWRDIATRLRYF